MIDKKKMKVIEFKHSNTLIKIFNFFYLINIAIEIIFKSANSF